MNWRLLFGIHEWVVRGTIENETASLREMYINVINALSYNYFGS